MAHEKVDAKLAPDVVDHAMKTMIEADVIEPSDIPWASPVVLVRKKDGSTHYGVDFRRLKEVTHKGTYPLPSIEDTFDSLAGSQYFSTLNFASRFCQVKMASQDKEKTAFTMRQRLYQFKVMPFGLCNSTATFERLIESVFRGMLWAACCLAFIDDIGCSGRSCRHMQC